MTEYCWSFPCPTCHSPEHVSPMRGVLLRGHSREGGNPILFVTHRDNLQYTYLKGVLVQPRSREECDAGSSGRRHHRFGL